MVERRRRAPRGLRDTIDRVLVHDIKNMGFRLEMLRSNLEEHHADPEFRRSVQELLSATVEKLDRIVGRWAAQDSAVLIKVALDVNGLIREAADSPRRRGSKDGGPRPSLALGDAPSIWGDPFQDATQARTQSGGRQRRSSGAALELGA